MGNFRRAEAPSPIEGGSGAERAAEPSLRRPRLTLRGIKRSVFRREGFCQNRRHGCWYDGCRRQFRRIHRLRSAFPRSVGRV